MWGVPAFSMIRAIAFAFAAFLFGCVSSTEGYETVLSANSPDGVIQTDVESHVRFDGILNFQNVLSFQSQEELPGTLVVASPGGDPMAALIFAEFLNDKNIEVIIDGVCASACVSLFLSLQNVSLTEQAIFVSHSDTHTRIKMITSSRQFNEDISLASRESFYSETGEYVDNLELYSNSRIISYWRYSTMILEPSCVGRVEEGKVKLSNNGRLSFDSKYSYWIPSGELLKEVRGDGDDDMLDDYTSTLRERTRKNMGFFINKIVNKEIRPFRGPESMDSMEWMSLVNDNASNIPFCE